MHPDRYSGLLLAYDGADPTFAQIGAARPWLRLDLAEPSSFRYYDGTGALKTKASGLLATALREASDGVAGLNSSSKVIQDPANATVTPTASKIPIANGSGKLDVGWLSVGSASGTLCAGDDKRLLGGLDSSSRIFRPMLVQLAGISAAFAPTSGKAYWCYLGRATADIVIPYVNLWLTAASAAVTSAECGLFSAPNPPNGSAQTMTLIEATGTMGSFTSGTGLRRNTAAFTTTIPAGTHVYAGFRETASAGGPSVKGCGNAFDSGALHSLASATSFVSASSWAAAIVTEDLTVHAPFIWGSLD